MTLNLLTYVPEGLVLLVDSMATSETFMPFQGPKVTTYDHAMKIFDIGSAGVRAAVMISGVGDIGGTLVSQIVKGASRAIDKRVDADSVAHGDCVDEVFNAINPVYDGMVADFKRQILEQIRQNPKSLEELNAARAARSKKARETIEEIGPNDIGLQDVTYPPDRDFDLFIPVPPLEVVVASHVDFYAASVLRWPSAVKVEVITSTTPVGNVWWWGSGGSAVSRIIKGYDNNLLAGNAGTGDEGAKATLAFFSEQEQAVKYQMPFLLSVMPLQEAVYFTEYLSDVACGYDRFKAGPAGVGGAINVMVITDDRRQWLRQDRIQSRPAWGIKPLQGAGNVLYG